MDAADFGPILTLDQTPTRYIGETEKHTVGVRCISGPFVRRPGDQTSYYRLELTD